jgi:hypothetical protein
MSNRFSESTDIDYLIRHMMNAYSTLGRGAIFSDFAEKYFRKVQSCHHVIGTNYGFVTGCRYNRRAFVYMLEEALSTSMLPNESTTSSDIQQLIEFLCEDFPHSVVTDALTIINPLPVTGSKSNIWRYKSGDLRTALYFLVIFEKWLKVVESIFNSEGVMDRLSTHRLQGSLHLIKLRDGMISIEEPPSEGVRTTLLSLTENSDNSEITFVTFRRALITNHIIIANIYKVPPNAAPIIAQQAVKLPPLPAFNKITNSRSGSGKGKDAQDDPF